MNWLRRTNESFEKFLPDFSVGVVRSCLDMSFDYGEAEVRPGSPELQGQTLR